MVSDGVESRQRLVGDLLDDEYDGTDSGVNMNTKVETLPHRNLKVEIKQGLNPVGTSS